jgi:formate dehydrogenase major subunit
MPLEDEAARIHVGSIWDANVPTKAGLSAPEMIHQVASGKIRALYVIGENPAVSEPQSNFVAWMLQRLELLIVQDIFPIETLKYADIVLPAAMMGEKEGSVTNAARRIQFTAKGVRPPGEAKPDWQILQEMATAMGANWRYSSTSEIWEEIRIATACGNRRVFSGLAMTNPTLERPVFTKTVSASGTGGPDFYRLIFPIPSWNLPKNTPMC